MRVAVALYIGLTAVHSITALSSSFIVTNKDTRRISRRDVLLSPASALAVLTTFSTVHPSLAFDNAIPEAKKYADKPKRRGTAPKDLGVATRTVEGEDSEIISPGLRTCDGNPNCFSTTGDFSLDDRTQIGVDWLIQPWKPPADDSTPLVTVSKAVKAYTPGQGGIDGAGFSVVKEKDSYLYYQFESLKKGYIDDLEFATGGPGGTILVRSASRVGYTDFGVNAIRLNYLAEGLRSKGWVIPEITPDSHRDYWLAANDARDATFDADRRLMDTK